MFKTKLNIFIYKYYNINLLKVMFMLHKNNLLFWLVKKKNIFGWWVLSVGHLGQWVKNSDFVLDTPDCLTFEMRTSGVRIILTCPCKVWQVDLCDESVSVRARLSKVSRFRMDHMTLAIRVQNLQRYIMNQLLLFSKNLKATASKNVAVSASLT